MWVSERPQAPAKLGCTVHFCSRHLYSRQLRGESDPCPQHRETRSKGLGLPGARIPHAHKRERLPTPWVVLRATKINPWPRLPSPALRSTFLCKVAESSRFLAGAWVSVTGCFLHFTGGHTKAQATPGLGPVSPPPSRIPPSPHPPAYLVHMMDDSRLSSDQMRAVQSPTVRKFFG